MSAAARPAPLSSADQLARSRFQSGLLAWLRGADDPSGLREMIAVVRGQVIDDAANALLWRSAEGFLQNMLEGRQAADAEARQLCRRLERQLGRGKVDVLPSDPADLRQALFDYVSNRAQGVDALSAEASAATGLARAEPPGLLQKSLGATADILPLMTLGITPPRRFSDEQHARWKQAAARLEGTWHGLLTGDVSDGRNAATQLVQVALDLGDPAGLRLAEALADAIGLAEDKAHLERPAFRAAVAAALEIAIDADGPEQKVFDDKVDRSVRRLAENRQHRERRLLSGGATPWFVEDAREWLRELHAAIDAVPPKRLALLAGVEWLAQQETCSMMAIRGLSTLALKVIGQVRSDDLDEPATHDLVKRLLGALDHAVDELAAGHPPLADESVFADLRDLDARLNARRKELSVDWPSS